MRFDEPGLEAYLKEINQLPLLSAAEEKRLARRIAKGDRDARDRMIRANLRLVVHLANRYARPGVALMDLGRIVAEGTPDELRERYGAKNLEDVFMEVTNHE